MKKNNNVFLGLIFVALAALYVLTKVGWFPYWNLFDIGWGIIGVALLASGIKDKNYYYLFIGMAFILSLLKDYMFSPFLDNFSFFSLIIVAILFATGFELMTGGTKLSGGRARRNSFEDKYRDEQKRNTDYTSRTTYDAEFGKDSTKKTTDGTSTSKTTTNYYDEEEDDFITVEIDESDAPQNGEANKAQNKAEGFYQSSQNQNWQKSNGAYYTHNGTDPRDNLIFAESTFTTVTKYVRAAEFEGGDIRSTFGNLRVDLSESTLSQDGAKLAVSCSFGKITLFVPRDWAVLNNVGATLGNVSDDRAYSYDTTTPQLEVFGQVSLGQIEIIYV